MLRGLQRGLDKYIGKLAIIGLILFKKTKNRPGKIRRIAIIRLWAIGEAILTLPMIKRIKEKYPNAEITVICRARVQSVFNNQKFVDKVELLSPKLINDFNKYDVAFDTEPYLNIAAIINFWISKFPIGYSNKLSRLINSVNVPFNENVHAADNFVKLAALLKTNQKALTSLIKLDPGKKNKEWARKYVKTLNKPIIGICHTAGESAKSREWTDGKWIKLLRRVNKKYGGTMVFVTSRDNLQKVKLLQGELDFETYDTTNFSLKQSIALVSKLDIMLSIDTGPMHIAAAQGVPTIGLFCPNTPLRFGPLGKKNSFVYKPVRKKPCINVHKGEIPDCKGHGHMRNIQVEDVLNEIDKLNKKWKIFK